MSSHIFPEMSAHLICATPGAHHLEWLDFAGAILLLAAAVVVLSYGSFRYPMDMAPKSGTGLAGESD